MSSKLTWFRRAWLLVLLTASCTALSAAPAYKTKHVFIVVMDGVRYSDTFGDETHQLIPHLYNDLRPQGTLFTNCYDRGVTVTRQGHSTLISGTWQKVPNAGPRLTRPTLFEYYRDEKDSAASKCWSVFGKARYSFEPYSSHPAYGSRLAGEHINGGGSDNPITENTAAGDVAVLNKVIEVMKADQPAIMFVNFGYTDHAGHIAKDISEYKAAIKNCDEQMWKLWNAIQADPTYRDTTTVFFTNDHGRHTSDFHSHGDHCEGCEHIMLLVMGPDIKKGVVVENEVLQIDIAPTAAELLGLQTPLATGRVLKECLTEYLGINKKQAVTETGRRAIAIEKAAGRDLIKAAADYVLANMKPGTIPADFNGELLARGMLRAYSETTDERYLKFAQEWISAHKESADGGSGVSLGDTILDLPAAARQEHMSLARQIGDTLNAEREDKPERFMALRMGVFLGRLAEVSKETTYAESGRELLKDAVAEPGLRPATPLQAAEELALLGQAAAVFPDESVVMKAFVVAAVRSVRGMKEQGGLWDDPIVSVLNLYGIEASKRRAALRKFVKMRGPKAVLPPCVEAMTEEEVRALFADRPKAPLPKLKRQIVGLIFQGCKQNISFSLDMLRYGINEKGAYADGSPAAQGGFLLAYRKLGWRYGGSTWPGPQPPQKPKPQ